MGLFSNWKNHTQKRLLLGLRHDLAKELQGSLLHTSSLAAPHSVEVRQQWLEERLKKKEKGIIVCRIAKAEFLLLWVSMKEDEDRTLTRRAESHHPYI